MDIRKSKNYDPKGVGEKSTAQIIARMLAADKVVLMPFGDNQRYDIVVDEDGKLIRVQCKTACFKGEYFVFSTCSTNWNTKRIRGYKGEADLFLVYEPVGKEIYVFNVNKCPDKLCTVRFGKTRNGQSKGIRVAKEHVFQVEKSLSSYMGDV